MSTLLYRIGHFAARRPLTTIGTWIVVAALVLASSAAFGRELEESFDVPGLDSHAATALLTEAGSDQAGVEAHVALTPRERGATFRDPGPAAELAEVRAGAATLPSVLAVGDPAGAVSPDGRVALVRLQYRSQEELRQADLEALKAFAASVRERSSLQVEAGGELFLAFEESPAGVAEAIGIVAAALILLVAFGSLIAMGLPIGLALFGLAVGIGSVSLVAHVVDVPAFAPEIATMLGLGVGIDYALFVVTRHREHLAAGSGVVEAAAQAVATAGRAVLFAGGTVVIAILGLAFAGVPFLAAAGVGIAVVVLTMVLTCLTLLPAFLGLAGERIGRRRARAAGAAAVDGRWRRWGEHVSSHAAAYAVGATVLLLALAAPALDMRLANPDDGTLSESRTERRAYDLIATGFGPGANGPLLVAVDVSEDPAVLEPLRDAIAADRGVASVAPARVNRQEGVATLLAQPTTAPEDDATVATIERLRGDVLPAALAGTPARAHVGGATATWADLGDRIADRLPWLLAGVIGLSFLLLVVVFRSLLVPLKAAVLNLLSVGAAYGVLVMVFQWGWGASLIGLESTVPVIPFIPLFLFAIVFGLSMDYEVFLLSRIRESYLRSRDNDAAVIDGIGSTARVISAAALIMITVFMGFVFGNDPRVKMFGVGLATAILVDATIVRLILVPATLKLFGDANWWLPDWLERRLPAIAAGPRPGPAPEPAEA